MHSRVRYEIPLEIWDLYPFCEYEAGLGEPTMSPAHLLNTGARHDRDTKIPAESETLPITIELLQSHFYLAPHPCLELSPGTLDVQTQCTLIRRRIYPAP
mgnify:CR=1 FL=1